MRIKLPKWDKSLQVQVGKTYRYFIDPITNEETIINKKLEKYITKDIEIKDIAGYYSGLYIKKWDKKFYWGIASYCDGLNLEEIDEKLYNELLRYKK